jgi:predicted  nucleic acid-binding Zn-ribbon protein
MNQETGIWIAGLSFAFGVLGAFVRFVQRLSRLESRVDKCESESSKIDAVLARLAGQMQSISETLGAVRLYTAENYVPLERMASVEDKIDGLSDRSSKIEASQAEHGAILKSIQGSLTEMKAAISRPSIGRRR